MVHGGTFTHPLELLQRTLRAINEFQAINKKKEDQPHKLALQINFQWTTPSTGWVKANWDASLDTSHG